MDTIGNRVVINVSKRKLWMLLLGALVFVAAGAWMAWDPHALNQGRYRSPVLIRIVGTLGVLFFGACGYFIARKLKSGDAGLVIDAQGFSDQSSATAVGWVPWSDVEDLSVFTVQGQRFVLVQVRNPDGYLSRLSGLSKKAAAMNLSAYGSPVTISANGLETGFDDLIKVLKKGLEDYRRRQGQEA